MKIHPTARGALLAAAIATVAVPFLATVAQAQDLHSSRRPSPMGMARITLDDTYIRVVYSRPYERDRDVIFGSEEDGALVPYGQIWRTGANEATEITLTGDVTVAGEPLGAGTYSLFTIPGPEEWKVHFVGTLGMSGTGFFADGELTPVDIPAETVLAVTAKPTTLAEDDKVDQLTFSFDKTGERSADLVLRWILTEVRVPIALAE